MSKLAPDEKTMPIVTRIARNLDAEFARNGLRTQQQQADAIGFSVDTLQRRRAKPWEWRLTEIQRIADAVGVELGDLIGT
jgi:hypothetical protein